MAKFWDNPSKRPPQKATLETEGNFEEFTLLMKRLMTVKPVKPATVRQDRITDPAASLAPDVSCTDHPASSHSPESLP